MTSEQKDIRKLRKTRDLDGYFHLKFSKNGYFIKNANNKNGQLK